MSQTVRFTYQGVNYDFRRPIIGNTDELSFQRVNRRTRGGDLVLFRDPDWPKTEVLSLTFDFDTDAEAHRLLNFIKASIGTNMTYRDHENRVWSGVIQNPDAEIVQIGRFSFRLTVLFEGDQV